MDMCTRIQEPSNELIYSHCTHYTAVVTRYTVSHVLVVHTDTCHITSTKDNSQSLSDYPFPLSQTRLRSQVCCGTPAQIKQKGPTKRAEVAGRAIIHSPSETSKKGQC